MEGGPEDKMQSIQQLPTLRSLSHTQLDGVCEVTCAAFSLEGELLATMRLMRGRLILWMKSVNMRGARNTTILNTLSFICGKEDYQVCPHNVY